MYLYGELQGQLGPCIAKTEVVVFGGGYHMCSWKVAGQDLKRSQSFTYLGMLFHEDRHIKHALRARYSKACFSWSYLFPLLQAGMCQFCAASGAVAASHSAAFCLIWL